MTAGSPETYWNDKSKGERVTFMREIAGETGMKAEVLEGYVTKKWTKLPQSVRAIIRKYLTGYKGMRFSEEEVL